MFEPVSLFVASLITLPALLLAVKRSYWLVDYLFLVVAFNRGIRRFVDYQNGFFNPYSFISVTPLIVGGLVSLIVVLELTRKGRKIGACLYGVLIRYGIAVAWAFIVGFVNSRFAAAYALGDYLAPIGLLGFGYLASHDKSVIDRWCKTFAIAVSLVAAYGILQFYLIPPWDAFWLLATGMDGYMGIPEPTKMTLFSTLNERGPAASFLCGGLILLLLRRETLGILSWPCIMIISFAMLLTYSRTVVIQSAAAVLLYPILNNGRSFVPTAVLLIFLGAFGPSILEAMPGFAAQRVGTIANITTDGSYQGRLIQFRVAISEAIYEPVGLGMGSHGVAGRVSSSLKTGASDSTGYVETLRTFGWIGFALVVSVLWKLWKASQEAILLDRDDANVSLFRAWFASGLLAFYAGDWMFTATFFWILAGYALNAADISEASEYEESHFISDFRGEAEL